MSAEHSETPLARQDIRAAGAASLGSRPAAPYTAQDGAGIADFVAAGFMDRAALLGV